MKYRIRNYLGSSILYLRIQYLLDAWHNEPITTFSVPAYM